MTSSAARFSQATATRSPPERIRDPIYDDLALDRRVRPSTTIATFRRNALTARLTPSGAAPALLDGSALRRVSGHDRGQLHRGEKNADRS
jgi:hypothetical protein